MRVAAERHEFADGEGPDLQPFGGDYGHEFGQMPSGDAPQVASADFYPSGDGGELAGNGAQ